ncbi:MAG: hypothetical protein NE328_23235 [Lentisphaeraceae bacterium]|nr:hypothetical protein [Lentisphaeraceae bacterium]
MGFIERTEKRFGKFAVNGLGLKLVVFQCIIFLLLASQDLVAIEKRISFFNFPGTHFITDFLLLAGMPSVFPINALSYIWLFFGSYILIMCANGLEEIWGSYKFNLYILTYLFIGTVTLHLIREFHNVGIVFTSFYPSSVIPFNMLSLLHITLFLAFAIKMPHVKILFMFIIPVSFGFLAIIETLAVVLLLFNSPGILLTAFYFGTTLFPPILFNYKEFLTLHKQRSRTKQFSQKVKIKEDQAFHKCKVCGKTENDDSTLEFRIADSGEEYCEEHLKEANKSS